MDSGRRVSVQGARSVWTAGEGSVCRERGQCGQQEKGQCAGSEVSVDSRRRQGYAFRYTLHKIERVCMLEQIGLIEMRQNRGKVTSSLIFALIYRYKRC